MTTTTLVDRVKIIVVSSGSGPFQLGNAVAAYRGVEALTDGASYNYATESGSVYEAGTGVYLASSGTLVRSPQISSNNGGAVSFPAGIELSFTVFAADIFPTGSLPIVQTTGTGTAVAMSQDATTTELAGLETSHNGYVADLASTASGKGASLVGVAGGVTVQEAFNGLNGTGPLVIAIAGQSNALGANNGGGNPSNSKVHTWDAVTSAFVSGGRYDALPWTRSSPDGNDGNNNYALAAAHDLQARTGRDVYVILDATGGTSIDEWVASGTSSTRYAALKTKVEAALATLTSKTTIDMLIWAQGEEDYLDTFATHLANVTTLDTQLRAETWMDDTTPVMCMGMSNLHNRYAPEKALRHYCGKVNQNWTFVSMKGLPTEYDMTGAGDYTHFLGASLYAGGLRAARAYWRGERSKEIAVLPFWGRGDGELKLSDATAIASFSHLVSWDSRDTSSAAVSSHAATGSIAWGEQCVADGNYTFALGYGCATDNASNYTILAGRDNTSNASGDYSAGFGYQNALQNTYTFAAGRGHTVTISGASARGTFSDATAINGSELADRVGVGTSTSARANAWAVTLDGAVYALKEYRVGANKVVGAQGAAVADATDAASAITQLNALLARCRAHGLIAT